jgi:predicted AlkP superfamily pyrophosphatase or phosphodiesterase
MTHRYNRSQQSGFDGKSGIDQGSSMRQLLARFVFPAALALTTLGAGAPLAAKDSAPQQAPARATSAPPRLIVAIAVDQFSADLFAQYRQHFTGGIGRLLVGAVFPSGYQSHAATETCPGHSTLLTGVHPSRNGIIANYWFTPGLARAEKRVYCAEDESDPASSSANPVVSPAHLRVPTLGDRLKAANPASRNVAVSAKDRAVVMMGGHRIDAAYWWKGGAFTSFANVPLAPAAQSQNRASAALIAKGAPAFAVPAWCAASARAFAAGGITIGQGRFALEPAKPDSFRVSPRIDAATADLAIRLIDELSLGKGAASDLLSVSFSATDYIGHAYGSEGLEMCIQMAQLDMAVGRLLAHLDKLHIDYAVVLSADHGGFDAPERLGQQAYPRAVRADAALLPGELAKAVTAKTGIKPVSGSLIYGDGPFGDFYFSASLSAADKTRATTALVALLKAHPQVAAVFTAQELAQTPLPSGSPADWSLKDRARASFDAQRSGDVVMLLDRAVVPIPIAREGYVATHGSPWDYDRRVPMLFWRRGLAGFEQPAPVETVDIAPSLAALLKLDTTDGDFDGRCLDLDGGPGNTCAEGK